MIRKNENNMEGKTQSLSKFSKLKKKSREILCVLLFVEVLGLFNAIKEEKIACLRYHLLLQKTDDKNYGYIKPGRFV